MASDVEEKETIYKRSQSMLIYKVSRASQPQTHPRSITVHSSMSLLVLPRAPGFRTLFLRGDCNLLTLKIENFWENF